MTSRFPIFNVAEPQTKGIVRPNAQCLSLAIAPLVTQRSILFRVQTELGDKSHYDELSSSDYSSALWTISAEGSSAVSATSAYSQESWKPEPAHVPRVKEDVRRYAMAFSPSVGWEQGADDSDPLNVNEKTPSPSRSFHSKELSDASSWKDTNLYHDPQPSDQETIPTPTTGIEQGQPSTSNGYPRPMIAEPFTPSKSKRLKKTPLKSPRRASNSTKVLGKVFSRLSLQPSRAKPKPSHHYIKRQTMPTLSPLKLPEIQFSPGLHLPFNDTPPSPLPVEVSAKKDPILSTDETHNKDTPIDIRRTPQLRVNNEPPLPSSVQISIKKPSTPLTNETPDGDINPIDRLRILRTTNPTPAPPIVPIVRKQRGHRRYRSSPAVPAWSLDKLPSPPPPLPVTKNFLIDPVITQVPRTRSRSMGEHPKKEKQPDPPKYPPP